MEAGSVYDVHAQSAAAGPNPATQAQVQVARNEQKTAATDGKETVSLIESAAPKSNDGVGGNVNVYA